MKSVGHFGFKQGNEYAAELGEDVYGKCPKAVFAAIAVSALTCGGDHLDTAESRILEEWWALYHNGVVPQKPPRAERIPESDDEG